MSITWYMAAIILVIIAAFIGTLLVARNPEDRKYGQLKRRMRNLILIYIAGTILALLGFYMYWARM